MIVALSSQGLNRIYAGDPPIHHPETEWDDSLPAEGDFAHDASLGRFSIKVDISSTAARDILHEAVACIGKFRVSSCKPVCPFHPTSNPAKRVRVVASGFSEFALDEPWSGRKRPDLSQFTYYLLFLSQRQPSSLSATRQLLGIPKHPPKPFAPVKPNRATVCPFWLRWLARWGSDIRSLRGALGEVSMQQGNL